MTNISLPRSAPELHGIASASILQFVEAVEAQVQELHSFMLLRHGVVVAEGWWKPYGPHLRHVLFSLSKSFTSSAIGFAVSEGLLTVDDLVTSFFPDDLPAEVSPNLAAMRVRHLLSMSTGHDEDTTGFMHESPDGNWTKTFLARPVVHEPGTHFLYNTGATYMLSAIIQKLTGIKLIDYLQPRLLEPLGIEDAWWEESPQGINTGGYGLNIRTEDIAKFGQLYLQKGMWHGKQLLPESWIEEATSKHISNGDPSAASDWTQGYGYQFWRCQHGGYRGDGAFGQYCVVLPEQDAVLAMTGGLDDMQIPLNLVWEHLLPAMQNKPLPADSATQQKLTEKLSSLSYEPPQGKRTSSIAAGVSGRFYKVDPNETDIEAIRIEFGEANCMYTVKTKNGESRIPCGYGEWVEGETALFVSDPWRIVTSGVWTAEDTFAITIRSFETPFVHTFVGQFVEDRLNIELSANVSFGPLRFSLVGRAVGVTTPAGD